MGRALLHEAAGDGRFQVAGAIGRGGDTEALFEAAEVVLDFSAASAAIPLAKLAGQTGKALLVGTTGLDDQAIAALQAAAASAPVLIAPNTSVGIALLASFAREAAARLGAEFRIEIEDIHHKDKKDAPSGTALMLGSVVADARNLSLDDLTITSERSGDAAGKHRVSFIGVLERIDLVHEAADRAVFARGALDVAHWLAQQQPGLYTMDDFLRPAGD
jgi:4-hydroxy-tetrahydrodipicolinate reductase